MNMLLLLTFLICLSFERGGSEMGIFSAVPFLRTIYLHFILLTRIVCIFCQDCLLTRNKSIEDSHRCWCWFGLCMKEQFFCCLFCFYYVVLLLIDYSIIDCHEKYHVRSYTPSAALLWFTCLVVLKNLRCSPWKIDRLHTW